MKNSKNIYAITIILLFWYIIYFIVDLSVVPSPHDTIITFIKLFPMTLSKHILISLFRIFIAISIALIVGVTIGLVTGMNNKIDKLITPIIYILYPVPKIAFLPVFMILLGIGDLSKIVLIIVIIIFPIIVTTRDGVKELSNELFYSVRSLGLSNYQIYRHMIIPGVMPNIITALRISIGTSIAVLFYAENFATEYGIGYFIMNKWITVDYLEMFSGILALSIMGFGIFRLIDIIENRLCKWVKVQKIKN
ncbi:ABC transporter permease [Senegalia massiliensis]|uniref:ABC transporter permease n=1 Tax=Senegalia massiliensis TaxID=1720316 RepID=A0A845QYY5_9CLOT|nr:ABC transporter permease [Senegalia massiliensis]NBI06362.1 ABC transporter permease [Senegalia massiliensis]